MKFASTLIAAVMAIPAMAAPAPQIPGGNHGGIINFIGRLTIAQTITERTIQSVINTARPDVKLWTATATSTSGRAVPDVWGLDSISARLVGKGREGTHEYNIKEASFNAWPKKATDKGALPGPIMGAAMINIEDLKIDLARAEKIARGNAGLNNKVFVKKAEISWRVIFPGGEQPYWRIEFNNGKTYAVGAKDGKFIAN